MMGFSYHSRRHVFDLVAYFEIKLKPRASTSLIFLFKSLGLCWGF